MPITTLDILKVFVEFPGNLLFFLLVIALSQGSLFLAYGHRSRFPFELATRRYLVATAGLVVLWLIMLAAAFLAQVTELEADAFMPPMERLVFALSLLILAWAFLSADFQGWRNRSNLLIFATTFTLALLYLNSARGWLSAFGAGPGFNATDFAPPWSGVTAALAGLALLLALSNARQIVDAPLKVLVFLVFLAGSGWDLYQMSQGLSTGHYSGAARLAYLGGLILLPLIIYRLSIALLEHSLVEVVLAASQPSAPLQESQPPEAAPAVDQVDALLAAPSSWNFSAAPVAADRRHLLNAIGVMLETREGARIPEQIVRAALDTLQVEVCVLLRLQENNYADVIAGYDQVAEQHLAGVSLNLNEQPSLREAASRREQTILFPEYHADELRDLFRRLSIPALSGVYAQPLTVEDELIAVMLVAMPYRQADLSPEELDSLRDIGFVAGNLLAWSYDAASADVQTDEHFIDAIAGRGGETAIDQESLIAHRLELEASLERVRERSGRIARQIAELNQQQNEQHIRLLDALAGGDNGQEAAQRLNASIDEHAGLRTAAEASARALLDAETVLRVLNAGDEDALAQIIREYIHKEYNLLLTSRDRLRRQINALLVMGRSLSSDGYGAILQSLADESAQLELEREQQQRRLDSIAGRLDSMGIDADVSHLTQLLIQLYAERKTLSQHLAEANEDRRALLQERQRLMEAGSGDQEELESQLRHLSADHEQLLNSREELRREQQGLQARLEQTQADNEGLEAKALELEAALAAGNAERQEFGRQVADLVEERDNLLKIRDQLAAKVNALQAEGPDQEAEAILASELADLRGTVARLTEQREQLALDLSDARTELSAARDEVSRRDIAAAEDTQEYRLNVPDLFAGMLDNLRTPMTSVSDYADLLLAENIGILGAAQRQVLKMIAADISRMAEMISEIHKVARLDVSQFSLEHGSVDLISIIEDVIENVSENFAEKEQMVELALDDQLPPVHADGASLKHIFSQLVENAGAVSPAGSQITVAAEVGRLQLPNGAEMIDVIEISVADCGGGISSEDIQRVFARRYRAENREIDGFGDTGVSMTVAREFARANRGDLWITSDAGIGSVFHLALPLQLVPSIED